jgi:PAS domain S-box-containing protein
MLQSNAEEERWRLAIENAHFGVWDLDPRAELVHYSPQWKALLGFGAEDRPDSTSFWRNRVHPDDLPPMLKALHEHLDGFTPTYEMRFRLRNAGGLYRTVLSRGRVVERDGRGDAVRVVGTMTDLTHASHVPALSLLSREQAVQMSHELRTPLHAIIGFAQLLSGSLESSPPDEQRRRLALIEDAGWRLLALVDDLLERAVHEADKAAPR